jgi:hypothetical protein
VQHIKYPSTALFADLLCFLLLCVLLQQVNAIFLWNIISYDVLGIHYFSSSNQGSYRDNTVTASVTRHNAGVRSMGR